MKIDVNNESERLAQPHYLQLLNPFNPIFNFLVQLAQAV